MFPKKGNFFPGGNDRISGATDYAQMVATALRAEVGNSHRAMKTVMRWTGASERTVKHWFAGYHGPGGRYLLVLMRESEAVFEAVLTAADRRDAVIAARVLAAQGTLAEAMALVERVDRGTPEARSKEIGRAAGLAGTTPDDLINDRINDPINDRNREAAEPPLEEGLNPRQRWYLEALAAGKTVRASDLGRRWGVSEKTARRDVAMLKGRGMIELVGSRKMGRYRLLR